MARTEAQETGQLTQAIEMGQVVPGFPGVVELETFKPTVIVPLGCTGSLVTERVVVTAAHCVHPTLANSRRQLRVFYHDPQRGRYKLYDGHGQVFLLPGHDPSRRGSARADTDIALIRTDGRFGTGITSPSYWSPTHRDYVRLYVGDDDRLVGQRLHVYGAGFYTDAAASDTLLRTAAFPVDRVTDDHVRVAVREGVGLCRQDSGGPLVLEQTIYSQTMPFVVGVLSGGDQVNNCSNAGPSSGDVAYFSRVNWDKVRQLFVAAGVSCDLLRADGLSYRRCFQLPFIEDVAFEGLERRDAIARALTFIN